MPDKPKPPSRNGGRNEAKRDAKGRILPGSVLNPAGAANKDGGTRRASMRYLFDHGPEVVAEMLRLALDGNFEALKLLYERLIPCAPALEPMSEKAESGERLREWTVAEIKAQAGIP